MAEGFTPIAPLTPTDCERRIQRVIERLESETEAYDAVSRRAAEAEAEYKRQHAMTLLGIINSGQKMTIPERAARVDLVCADAHKEFLVTVAARNSAREHLSSLRDHLDALRTLSASVRGQA